MRKSFKKIKHEKCDNIRQNFATFFPRKKNSLRKLPNATHAQLEGKKKYSHDG